MSIQPFGIYRDVYKSTIWEKHFGMGRGRGAWAPYSGDVPVATIGGPHNGFNPVVNPRGNAYAYRNARKYRPTRDALRANAEKFD